MFRTTRSSDGRQPRTLPRQVESRASCRPPQPEPSAARPSQRLAHAQPRSQAYNGEQAPLTTKPKNPLLAAAQQAVAAAINPQLEALRQQQTSADDAARQRAGTIQDAYGALADILKPQAAETQAVYDTASQRQAAFGKGYSDTMRTLTGQTEGQANQLLAQNNSPQQVNANATGAADALYATGGFGPASALNAAGAAFGSAAAARPGQARSSGALLGASALMQGADQRKEIDQQIAALEAKRPGLLQEALGGLQDQEREERKYQTDLDFRRQELALAKQRAGEPNFFGSSEGGYYAYDPSTGQLQEVVKGTGPRPVAPIIVGTDSTGRYVWDRGTGTFTQVPGPLGAPSARTKQRFTPKQLSDFKADASAMARNTFWGVKDKKTGEFTAEPITYQEAMAEMLNYGIPLNIAQGALNRWWRKPGFEADVESRKKAAGNPRMIVWDRATKGMGRPSRTYQERTGKAGAVAESAAYQAKQQAVVETASEALGTPYVWGGESPSGFDCSGLLQYVWGKAGVQIPRVTYDQWKTGRPVSKSSLEPGDAVFFRPGTRGPEHVGMYLGDGKFIEAPRRGTTVRVSTLAGRDGYMGARRFV